MLPYMAPRHRRRAWRAGVAAGNYIKGSAKWAGRVASVFGARKAASMTVSKRRPVTKSKSTALAVIPKKARTYTADPTNKIQTTSSGGMTTHSMTVRLGTPKTMMQKLLRSSKESYVLRFGAIQPFNNTVALSISGGMAGGGAYSLVNFNSIAAAATGAFMHQMPLHVFDLTSINNVNAGNLISGEPMRRLEFLGTCVTAGIYPTNRVDFSVIGGRQADGVTAADVWQIEKTPYTAANTVPAGMIMQEWSQIKMLCYGAKTHSTRFKIQVVQIIEDDFHPLEITQLDATAPGSSAAWDDVSAPINFWQGVASASYKHPIATISTDYRKSLKVIKEYNFIVDPTTTIEERAEVGHSKALNIFVPMYRTNNYNSKAQALDASVADADNFGTEVQKNEAYLKPRARIYLIVQATNPYTQNSASPQTFTTSNTPSYDIVIRNKFSQLS